MILHKYVDRGASAFANIEFAPKDRVLLSITRSGIAVLKMIFGGRLPVKTLYSTHALIMERMARVLLRDLESLPERPRAKYERDEAAMMLLLDAAILDIGAAGAGGAIGAVDRLDLDNLPPRPIALFTRYAATAADSADFTRKLERLANIPG